MKLYPIDPEAAERRLQAFIVVMGRHGVDEAEARLMYRVAAASALARMADDWLRTKWDGTFAQSDVVN